MQSVEREQVHVTLEHGLSVFLASQDFVRKPDSRSRGQTFRRWERRVRWRIDAFEMVTEDGVPDESGPALQMNIELPLPDGTNITVTGGAVGWLISGRAGPLLSYSELDQKRNRVARDATIQDALIVCRQAIEWFDVAGAPESARAKLGRGNPSKFGPGHPVYIAMHIVSAIAN